MRRRRRLETSKTISRTAKIITTSIVATPLIMSVPALAGAMVILDSTTPVVLQHIDDYLAEYIDNELAGDLIIGDSITVDLDDIFEDADSLDYTVITYNGGVAAVSILSGDLHINTIQEGSTMVEIIARTSIEGTPIYEQFQLNVASIDSDSDGDVEIDDIVTYMNLNPGRLTTTALEIALQSIDSYGIPNNESPTTHAAPYNLSLYADEIVTLNMNAFFTDPDGDELTYAFTDIPDSASFAGISLAGSELTVEGSAQSTAITISASDGEDGHIAVTKQFYITILNSEPTGITLSNLSIAENTALSTLVGVLSTTDIDADDTYTYSLVEGTGSEDNGSFGIVGNNLITESVFDYELPKTSYSLRVRATDQDGLFTDQIFTISVTDVNDAPAAIGESYDIAEDTVLSGINVLDNDTDDESDMLTAVKLSDPANGSLIFNEDGTFTYTPNPNSYGAVSFDYKVYDGSSYSETVTVSINVSPVNDAPIAVGNTYTTNEDETLTVLVEDGIALFDNDYDPEGSPIFAELMGNVSNGLLMLYSDGSFTYTPALNFFGTDSFTYRVTDGELNSSIVTVTIDVIEVNHAPIAMGESYTTAEDTIQILNVLDNDADVDGDVLTAIKTSDPANGTVVYNSVDGTFTYTPDANFYGTDQFTYKVNDGLLDSNIVTVTINVTGVNDVPVVSNIIPDQTVHKDSVLSFVVPSNTFTDVETANLNYGDPNPTLSNGAALPSWLSFDPATRTFSGTPANSDVGAIIVRVSATDGQHSVPTEFTIHVVNDAPVALYDFVDVTLYNEQTVEIDVSQYFEDVELDLLDFSYTVDNPSGDGKVDVSLGVNQILTVGYSGALTSPTDISIVIYADDVGDNHDPVTSTINVNYATEDISPSYLYVDPNSVVDLNQFYTIPDYNNGVPVELSFSPMSDLETNLIGISIDAAGHLNVTSGAVEGANNSVTIIANDGNGATFRKDVQVIVDSEIIVVETAPSEYFGSDDGLIYYNVDLTEIFHTTGASFSHYSIQDWDILGLQFTSGGIATNGSSFANPGLFLGIDYYEIPMTLTIQAHDTYGHITSHEIALKLNHTPLIGYDIDVDGNQAILIGLEYGAGAVFDASHYAYDEDVETDGDVLSYEFDVTDAVFTGAITWTQNDGVFQLQGTARGELKYDLLVTDARGDYSYMPVEVYVVDKLVKLGAGNDLLNIDLSILTAGLGLVNPVYGTAVISNPSILESANVAGSTLTLLNASPYGGETLITIPTSHDSGATDLLIYVEVEHNHAPSLVDEYAVPEVSITNNNELTIDLATMFTDFDEDVIEEYNIANLPGGITASLMNTSMLHIQGLSSGSFTFVVEARDEHGAWSEGVYIPVYVNYSSVGQSIMLDRGATDTSVSLLDYLGYNTENNYESNGYSLMYSVTSTDSSIVTATIIDGYVHIQGVAAGEASITISGDNGSGIVIKDTLTVTVEYADPLFTDPGMIKINVVTSSGGYILDSYTPEAVNLSELFSDPYNENAILEYKIDYVDQNSILTIATDTTDLDGWFTDPNITMDVNDLVDTYMNVSARIQAHPYSVTTSALSVKTTNAPIAYTLDAGNYLTFLRPGESVTFSDMNIPNFPIYDQDYDELSYSAEVISGPGSVSIVPNGSTFDIHGVAAGEVTIQVTIEDGGDPVTANYVLNILDTNEYTVMGYLGSYVSIDVGLLLDNPISVSSSSVDLVPTLNGTELTVTATGYTSLVNYNEVDAGKYVITVSNAAEQSVTFTIYIIPTNPV